MNLDQLRSFVAVTETGHFTRAADALHLAQPSLSRQIAALERDLGSELLHRARGHIVPTRAGEALLPYARRMLGDAQAIRRELAELAGLAAGRVSLGATPSLCASLVTDVVVAFHAEHPGIEIELREQGSRDLVGALLEAGIDLALLTSTTAPVQGLHATPLLTEELVVASSALQAAITRRRTITLAELARLPQVVFNRSYDLRAATDAAFEQAGLAPTVVLEGPEMDAVLRFVERGLGVAVVPAMVTYGRPGLRSVRLVEPTLTRTVRLAHRADVTPSRAALALRDALIDTADALAGRRGAITRA